MDLQDTQEILRIPLLGIETEAGNVYISSDQHLDHANIIKYAGRKYDCVQSMNEDIIARHNSVVPAQGSLWICLGDFAFVRGEDQAEQLRRWVRHFNGETKVLVMGNHDRQSMAKYKEAGFDYVVPKATDVHCSIEDFSFIMRHRPYSDAEMHNMERRNSSHSFHSQLEEELEDKRFAFDITSDNAWVYDLYPIVGNIMCGHVHQLYRRYAKGNVVNVGVDAWDMSPVPLCEALRYFN